MAQSPRVQAQNVTKFQKTHIGAPLYTQMFAHEVTGTLEHVQSSVFFTFQRGMWEKSHLGGIFPTFIPENLGFLSHPKSGTGNRLGPLLPALCLNRQPEITGE